MEENREQIMAMIEDDVGVVKLSEEVCPGVYYIAAFDEERGLPGEYYIAVRSSPVLTAASLHYGTPLTHHSNLLSYRADDPENGRMVLEYEVNRYLAKNGLPLMESSSLLSDATFGREHNPEYFGDYPAPIVTPMGLMLRYVTIMSGVFIIETERLDKVISVCYPIWNCDLSKYTLEQAKQNDYDREREIHNTEGYLFFSESSACLALFELCDCYDKIASSEHINRKAMMNAIWHYHPSYAASYNVREQTGLNDCFGLFMQALGCDVELTGNIGNVISLDATVGLDYLLI